MPVGDVGAVLLAVWAGPDLAIAAGFSQTIVTLAGAAPMTALSGVPAGEYHAVWAFASDDVWFGNNAAQLVHYDGSQWQAHFTGSKEIISIGKLKLWGQGGSLFVTAGNTFGRWDGSSLQLLDVLDGKAYFAGLWGNSLSEVFVAVHDSPNTPDRCGTVRVRWFNGSVVGPF
jgi:hypothetical protein